jgi:ribosome-associated protein
MDVTGPLRVSRSILIPEGELTWRFSRSSGPGGQSVNTADSRVSLSYDVASSTALGPVQRARALERLRGKLVDGVLTVHASSERSQLLNREAARERLAKMVAKAVAPPGPKRHPTKPSAAAVQRRLDAKRRRSRTKKLRRVGDDE